MKHDVKTMTIRRSSLMFRALVGAVASTGFVLAVASPALAHTKFDTEEVAPRNRWSVPSHLSAAAGMTP